MTAITLTGLGVVGLAFAFMGLRYRPNSLKEYISNHSKTGVLVTAMSLTASVVGAWILFSPGEAGSWSGIPGLLGYSIGQAAPLFVLAFCGTALRKRLPQGHGISEFVYHRYGKTAALVTNGLSIFYMAVFLAAELTVIGQALEITLDIPLWISTSVIMILIFSYVAIGGLKTSIQTDKIQFIILVPLLFVLVGAAIVTAGGWETMIQRVQTNTPQLHDITFVPGINFGIVLIIGVTASNLFHQGFWQRVYSAKDDKATKKSFVLAGFIILPIIFAAGYLGTIASSMGIIPENKASIASFFLIDLMHPVLTPIVLVLALLLVMSSIDTLLNGIISSLIAWKGLDENNNKTGILGEVLKVSHKKGSSDQSQLWAARIICGALAFITVIVAMQGFSALYLFLIANLLCSGMAFPILFGLFNKNLKGYFAITAGIISILAGVLFFPLPDWSSWTGLPADLLYSYGIALGLSVALTLLFTLISGDNNESGSH